MAATVVRSFSDEQLARSGLYLEGRPSLTVEQWIERILIGHPGAHLPAMLAGAEAARPEVPASTA